MKYGVTRPFPFPSPTGPQVGQANIFIPGNYQEKETQGTGFRDEQSPKQQLKYNLGNRYLFKEKNENKRQLLIPTVLFKTKEKLQKDTKPKVRNVLHVDFFFFSRSVGGTRYDTKEAQHTHFFFCAAN